MRKGETWLLFYFVFFVFVFILSWLLVVCSRDFVVHPTGFTFALVHKRLSTGEEQKAKIYCFEEEKSRDNSRDAVVCSSATLLCVKHGLSVRHETKILICIMPHNQIRLVLGCGNCESMSFS